MVAHPCYFVLTDLGSELSSTVAHFAPERPLPAYSAAKPVASRLALVSWHRRGDGYPSPVLSSCSIAPMKLAPSGEARGTALFLGFASHLRALGHRDRAVWPRDGHLAQVAGLREERPGALVGAGSDEVLGKRYHHRIGLRVAVPVLGGGEGALLAHRPLSARQEAGRGPDNGYCRLTAQARPHVWQLLRWPS